MGRKRLYDSDADRKRAYRERLKHKKPPYIDPDQPCPKCGKPMTCESLSDKGVRVFACRWCYPKPPLPSVPTPTIIKTEPLTKNEYVIAKYISGESEQPETNWSGVTRRSSIIYNLDVKCWTERDRDEPTGEWTREIIDNALKRLTELGLLCSFEKVISWGNRLDKKTGIWSKEEIADPPETHFFMVEEQRKALEEIFNARLVGRKKK